MIKSLKYKYMPLNNFIEGSKAVHRFKNTQFITSVRLNIKRFFASLPMTDFLTSLRISYFEMKQSVEY
jgi:hypothetical protein